MKNTPEKNYYLTTPIYYVNDKPHTGHAYTTIACDVLARFKRLDGYSVKFLTGTDEHGQKVAKAAAENKLSPKEFTNQVSETFRNLGKTLNITNTDFIRTTEPRHIKACQALWRSISSQKAPDGKPWIEKGTYSGWYSLKDEAYHTEDEIKTNESGQKFAPNGNQLEWVEEESFFFRLSAANEMLLNFYETHQDFILPLSRRNEVISFVKSGLRDLSISRTNFKWGVEVPGNKNHVMYVWIDALTNYLTSSGYPEVNSQKFKLYWPPDLHMIGKDIIRFHCVYWPAFLLAAGLDVPKRIFAHGWWTIEGQKMSKSLGNAIDPQILVDEYGIDQLRYFLLREVTFGNDGDFSKSALIKRSDSELANEFGNLVQRVLSMVYKNCDATIPDILSLTEDDEKILHESKELIEKVRKTIDKQSFSTALEEIWTLVRKANVYTDRQEPWVLKNKNSKRMETILGVLSDVICRLTIILQPFIPDSSEKILDQIALEKNNRNFDILKKEGSLVHGKKICKPEPIFIRLENRSN